jgi:hypothetical protein
VSTLGKKLFFWSVPTRPRCTALSLHVDPSVDLAAAARELVPKE